MPLSIGMAVRVRGAGWAAALADSKTVPAHGRGLIEAVTPATFDVIEVVIHIGT